MVTYCYHLSLYKRANDNVREETESEGVVGRTRKRRGEKETPHTFVWGVSLDSGSYLSSRAVSSQVLSAYEGLTSVFGMGTGGTLQLNHRKLSVLNTLETALLSFALIKPSTY